MEYDLKQIKKAGLKYPALFEEAAVQVLNRLSIQMRDLKKVMREKEIKVVYRGMNKDSVEYEIYVGKRKYSSEYNPVRLKLMAFEEIKNAFENLI